MRAEHGPAQLVALNNVYAHIPDVVGFTQGLRSLVADDGWVSIEVQHLLTLVERTQFDTIYHEHFQYYTVLTAQRALASGGLALVDVELLTPTAGRSGCGPAPSRWPASRRRPSATCSPPSRRPACTRRRGTTGSPPRCRGCVTTWSPS